MLLKAMSKRWPRAMRTAALGCLLNVAVPRCEAQNLVFNPSFELVDSCPTPPALGYGEGRRPEGWFRLNDSPDYFNRCQLYGDHSGVPSNIFGWQETADGDAYTGMWTSFQSTSDWHEMVASELLDPLTIGSMYYVSFYINAAAGGSEWPMLSSSHFGALFTMEAEEWVNGPSWPLRNYAQIFHPAVISDTASWLLVSGSFVADSAYRYIVLGNHFDNLTTQVDTIIAQDTIPGLYRAYTYVDQVCVSLDPLGCPLAHSIEDVSNNEAVIYPNPAVGELVISGLPRRVQVTVVDAIGRLQWQGRANGGPLVLDVAEWARGCYVALMQEPETIRSLKFVLTE